MADEVHRTRPNRARPLWYILEIQTQSESGRGGPDHTTLAKALFKERGEPYAIKRSLLQPFWILEASPSLRSANAD